MCARRLPVGETCLEMSQCLTVVILIAMHCLCCVVFGSLLPTDKLVIQSFLQDSRGELATEQSAVLDFRVAAQELLLTVPPRYDPSSSPLTGLRADNVTRATH